MNKQRNTNNEKIIAEKVVNTGIVALTKFCSKLKKLSYAIGYNSYTLKI